MGHKSYWANHSISHSLDTDAVKQKNKNNSSMHNFDFIDTKGIRSIYYTTNLLFKSLPQRQMVSVNDPRTNQKNDRKSSAVKTKFNPW